MVAQAAVAVMRAAANGRDGFGSRLAVIARSLPALLRSDPVQRPADDELGRLLQVVQLYRLVLDTVPDRPGLRHHADLLAQGHSLEELAASMLAVAGLDRTEPREAAAIVWSRAGGAEGGFEPAWQEAGTAAGFVASLVEAPDGWDRLALAELFPGGIDPEHEDVAPAWGYRLWSAALDRRLDRLAQRALPLLRLSGPMIVLRMTVDAHTDPAAMEVTVAALSRQSYGRWRLLLQGETPPGWRGPRDGRIVRFEARLPTRALSGIIAAGDVPGPACFALFALAALRHPLAPAWRCDEDRLDADGRRSTPRLDRAGGLLLENGAAPARLQFGGLRHLPLVLLHRRGREATRHMPPRIVADGITSVVIATRDRPDLLRRCVEGLRATTDPARTEIVLVDNGTIDQQALALLGRFAREGCVVLHRPGAFNWSALNNAGVAAARGSTLVLLNNDVLAMEPGWLERLVSACADPAVGIAGARLLHADGRVQHNGVLLGPGPQAVHLLDGPVEGDRPVPAVTGACMAMRRDVFDRLGGLEEDLPVTWNDLDLCLRAREAGLEVRLAAGCTLVHDEMGTRTPDTAPENRAQLQRTMRFVARRHRRTLRHDRFLHPLLLAEGGGRLLDPHAPERALRIVAAGGVG